MSSSPAQPSCQPASQVLGLLLFVKADLTLSGSFLTRPRPTPFVTRRHFDRIFAKLFVRFPRPRGTTALASTLLNITSGAEKICQTIWRRYHQSVFQYTPTHFTSKYVFAVCEITVAKLASDLTHLPMAAIFRCNILYSDFCTIS